MKRLFSAPAMDDAREVLPTPGGPTKHNTGPLTSGFNCIPIHDQKAAAILVAIRAKSRCTGICESRCLPRNQGVSNLKGIEEEMRPCEQQDTR